MRRPDDRPLRVRLSTDADGPAIGRLFAEAHYDDQAVDWTQPVGQWWLLAEDPDTDALLGVMQAIVSLPYGHIGELVVHPLAQGRRADGRGALHGTLGRVAMMLIAVGMDLMMKSGVQIVRGTVDPAARRGLMKFYEQRGVVEIGQVALMARRVA
jgi:hypothetical protein